MSRRLTYALGLLLGLLALFARPALAHWADLAVADVRAFDRTAIVTITIPTGLVKAADDDHDGRLSDAEVSKHAGELATQLGGQIQLTSGGEAPKVSVKPSKAAPPGSDLAGADGSHSTVEITYAWEKPVTGVTITYGLFLPGVTTARCLATVLVGDHVDNFVFTPNSPVFSSGEGSNGGILHQAASFIGLGIEHILTGYDHCLFIISLLMMGGGLGYVLKVVTAFTLAHSITLSLSVLDVVQLNARFTESVIALSIVYVAAENFWRKSLDGRWIVTFLFGLVHGFGFASALRETGLPRQNLAVSLASFNVGVEIGQLLVVTVAFALLGLVRGRSWEPTFRKGVSLLVIALASYWFVQRAFFTS